MPDLATIGTAVVTSGVVTAVVQAWIGKAIEHRYETNLERMRADIRLDAFRNETKFAGLHQKRAAVVAEIYAALRRLRAAVGNYASPGADIKQWPELRGAVINAIRAAYDSFNPNEIYLPAATAEKIQKYLSETNSQVMRFRMDVDNDEDDRRRFHTTWGEVSHHLAGESRVLFEELRDEFRRLIGDDAPPAAPADETR